MDYDKQMELFLRYKKLAIKIAFKYAKKIPRYIEVDDLKQIALIGLWNAIHKINSTYNERQTTQYIIIKIRGAMTDYLRSSDYLPRMMRKQIKDGKIKFIQFSIEEMENSDHPIALNYEEEDLERQSLIGHLLLCLSPQERTLIIRHFLQDKMMETIANELKICPGRASQIKKKALTKMRKRLNNIKFQDKRTVH